MERHRPVIQQRPHMIYEAQRAKRSVERPEPVIIPKMPVETSREAQEHKLGRAVMYNQLSAEQALQILLESSAAQPES